MTATLTPFEPLPIAAPEQVVPINLGDRSYDILIGHGIWQDPKTWMGLPQASLAVIVTNDTVAPLYEAALRQAISGHYPRVETVVLPDGESFKDLAHLQLIFDALLAHQADRKTVLFALGGGVVGDMTGFAAATYMRGVPFVQVPTTLLAQVDSSVGGKTGVNHPAGKNMIGAFYQPARVICDLATLDSLPVREYAAGLAEVIKYGPIADPDFLIWLEQQASALVAREPGAMMQAVKRSCEIKAWVVAQDEREGGVRAILNFGHTFGHAIEAGMGYGSWLHGEGVAAGMVMAAALSVRLGCISPNQAERLTALLRAVGLPVQGPALPSDAAETPAQTYLRLMRVDKKAQAGEIRFVVWQEGDIAALRTAPDEAVSEVIQACLST